MEDSHFFFWDMAGKRKKKGMTTSDLIQRCSSRYQPDRASDRPTAEGRREIRSAGGLGPRGRAVRVKNPRAVQLVITRAGTPVSNVIVAQVMQGEANPASMSFSCLESHDLLRKNLADLPNLMNNTSQGSDVDVVKSNTSKI
ncbi:hypothetical protein Bbelb_076640 [Branchiostoma belcheri]|nr:hypothetical protein Bbelb_076640 [Branchiostoma belcheri]